MRNLLFIAVAALLLVSCKKDEAKIIDGVWTVQSMKNPYGLVYEDGETKVDFSANGTVLLRYKNEVSAYNYTVGDGIITIGNVTRSFDLKRKTLTIEMPLSKNPSFPIEIEMTTTLTK